MLGLCALCTRNRRSHHHVHTPALLASDVVSAQVLPVETDGLVAVCGVVGVGEGCLMGVGAVVVLVSPLELEMSISADFGR